MIHDKNITIRVLFCSLGTALLPSLKSVYPLQQYQYTHTAEVISK